MVRPCLCIMFTRQVRHHCIYHRFVIIMIVRSKMRQVLLTTVLLSDYSRQEGNVIVEDHRLRTWGRKWKLLCLVIMQCHIYFGYHNQPKHFKILSKICRHTPTHRPITPHCFLRVDQWSLPKLDSVFHSNFPKHSKLYKKCSSQHEK